MRYIPHTEDDVRRMLAAVGVEAVDSLFACIPEALRLHRPLALPAPLDEDSLTRHLAELSARNTGSADRMSVFLGAGAYAHHVPAAVDQLLLRGEFFTAYTPYQPEVGQGTLQAIFEYQSMMAELLGVDVVNASMYDGATATAEAVLMALRVARKRSRVLLSRAVHPEVRATCRTYTSELEPPLEEVGLGPDGLTDFAALERALDERVAAVVVQQPNALGCLEPLDRLAALAHGKGAQLVVVVLEPVSLGLLQSPGALGADIVTGEGMGLGTGLNFGGPGLGLFGASSKAVWQMPGRLVGQTVDARGQAGYVLTMSTREQHIRRARATSNICSNEGLCALAAAIHLGLLGKQGFTELARTNAANARAAAARLCRVKGVSRAFPGPFFNEFALRLPGGSLERALTALAAEGILGGLPLARFYPELADHLLVCVTELHTQDDVERHAAALGRALQG
ncbi:MAG TPA: aminomethyl-transferring glycine dehydrogenase subunit GcvPA [Myxococcota bacterium]|nr:aminomethyl-transferring glycine dehydrogenase subunit GcvPA [Myxococcota bacterium]HRY95057.1 aminomethyl-transferring glycine dehydrogenase subunit GcvPA [Myxococcota bacterium]HSA20486.1 aminomethyl-transferring glycine dehydrogenase subunit GcvPA [Myxococcota bacterium]